MEGQTGHHRVHAPAGRTTGQSTSQKYFSSLVFMLFTVTIGANWCGYISVNFNEEHCCPISRLEKGPLCEYTRVGV